MIALPNILVLTSFLIFYLPISSQYSYDYPQCSSTQILNTKTLSCEECPSNMRPSLNQNIPTDCICTKGYVFSDNNQCVLASDFICGPKQFADIIQRTGNYPSTINQVSCSNCAQNAYPNENGTGCTPCPVNKIYSEGEGCICKNPSDVNTQRGCFEKSLTSGLSLSQSTSKYYEELKYLLPGCFSFKDRLSCSYLINLCTYSQLKATPECNFFDNNEFSSFLYPTDTNFSLSPGNFNKDTVLEFKLISFLPTGNYVGEKPLRLTDLFICGLPNNNSLSIRVGNNIEISCFFNFDHLVKKLSTFTYKNYVYELLIKGSDDVYYQVPIYINEGQTASKRFFLEDTYSSKNTITIMNKLKISFKLVSDGSLTDVKASPSYKTLTIQNSKINPSEQKIQELQYSVNFTYDLTNFFTAAIIIFVIVNVIVLIQSVIRSYIAYLNRQSPLAFFFYFAKFWSLWMFYFLLVFSGYWFLMSKTTQQLFLFVPDSTSIFYPIFYTLAGVMFVFRLLTSIIQKNEKLKLEVFMINWEKGHFRNSWRQIFIINSLAEFYTYRTVSIFYMLLCVMFFLVGLQWEKHGAEITHTDINAIYSFYPKNRVHLYFLGCSVFLGVGFAFKILRRLIVLLVPYPFQNFVDYCNVANISFFFIKKNSSQAYYIHASIPDRVQVTYKQINQAIKHGLTKNRTIANQTAFKDHQRMYFVYLCKDLQDKFNGMLKKLQNEKQGNQYGANTTKQSINRSKGKQKHRMTPREDFLERTLKHYLDKISIHGSGKTKTITQSFLGFPPVDLRDPNSTLKSENQVIFDDRLDLVGQVFPNGNQIQQIHTIIIIFLGLLLLTFSVSIAAFLTFFIDKYMIGEWVSNKCRTNLQKMTKVKQGFML